MRALQKQPRAARRRHSALGTFLAAVCLIAGALKGHAAPTDSPSINLPQIPNAYSTEALENPNAYITEGLLQPGFSTHLPVIAIEFLPGSAGSEANDWYNGLKVAVYDAQGENTLKNTPTAIIPAQGRTMENEALEYREKQDYYLRLEDAKGSPAPHGLLGLDESSEYFLIGSLYDRSLLRNYLGYTLAAQAMEDVPGVRFCEVVLRQGEGGDLYQGVYLLVEVRRTPGAYVFKRSTAEEGMFLRTYGSENHPEDGLLEVPFTEALPEDEAGWQVLWEIGGKISYIEEVIYSDNLDVFSRYPDLINTDSFINFFLINELLCNYTAKTDAYYEYDAAGNRLSMGPVWNFERALDNVIDEPMDIASIQFDTDGYFGQLIKSRSFLSRLQNRYLSLRTTVFHEDNYYRLIDDATAYLGPAMERDWHRWADYFAQHETTLALRPVAAEATAGAAQAEEAPFARNPESPQWEVQRILYWLRGHDLYMAGTLAFLDASLGVEMRGAEASYVRNTVLFALFLVGLAVVIHFARRYAE